jgi:hypothetical protein
MMELHALAGIFMNQDECGTAHRPADAHGPRQSLHETGFTRAKLAMQSQHSARLQRLQQFPSDLVCLLRASADYDLFRLMNPVHIARELLFFGLAVNDLDDATCKSSSASVNEFLREAARLGAERGLDRPSIF